MKKTTKKNFGLLSRIVVLSLFAVIVFSIGCRKSNEHRDLKDFQQVNLVANNDEYSAAHIDPTLQNAWGLVFNPGGIAWVNSQLGHVSELYTGEGASVRAGIKIPSPSNDSSGGSPTGIVFNGTTDFVLPNSQPALFIFVGTDGILSGWNGPSGSHAFRLKDNSATSAYTGLALANNAGANYLYAADFRGGKIVVWDKNFNLVSWMPFKDPFIPSGFSPFNIQLVGSWLVVTYAKVGPDGEDQAGPGNGFVDVFGTDGSFIRRFTSRGVLNSPWGVTQAPAAFFEDDDNDADDNSGHGKGNQGNKNRHDDEPTILIGNLGDGRINAFGLDGEFLGPLKSHNKPIVIDGLWALSFAPSTSTIDPNRLYFTAGPDDEKDGLFGYLIKK